MLFRARNSKYQVHTASIQMPWWVKGSVLGQHQNGLENTHEKTFRAGVGDHNCSSVMILCFHSVPFTLCARLSFSPRVPVTGRRAAGGVPGAGQASSGAAGRGSPCPCPLYVLPGARPGTPRPLPGGGSALPHRCGRLRGGRRGRTAVAPRLRPPAGRRL